MSDIEDSLTPPEVREAANIAINHLLPVKSRPRYENEYNKFMTWCATKNITNYSENCLLAYFQTTLGHKKSLWSLYSMLKSCLNIKHNVNISKYSKLLAFIKRTTEHHNPKKSAVLEEDHIAKFMAEAPDSEYLLLKVRIIYFPIYISNKYIIISSTLGSVNNGHIWSLQKGRVMEDVGQSYYSQR